MPRAHTQLSIQYGILKMMYFEYPEVLLPTIINLLSIQKLITSGKFPIKIAFFEI